MSRMSSGGEGTEAGRLALPALLCALLTLSAGVRAEERKGPLDEPDAYSIELQDDTGGGRTAYISGIATPSGAHLKLDSLWATQPVKLIVLPEEPDRPIEVELRKYHWQQPLRSCATAASGQCGFAFTSQGDVLITVISPDGPAKVYLAVKVGDEQIAKMKPVLIPADGKP